MSYRDYKGQLATESPDRRSDVRHTLLDLAVVIAICAIPPVMFLLVGGLS